MKVPNYYPELPEIPYERTTVGMEKLISYANNSPYPLEVKRMAYCMFRNESANGTKGVNGNYAGIQADCGRWSGLKGANGTCLRIDSGKINRRFICFDIESGHEKTFDFLCFKVSSRQMFIGAPGVESLPELVKVYLVKWVGRKVNPSKAEINNWHSLYMDACRDIVK